MSPQEIFNYAIDEGFYINEKIGMCDAIKEMLNLKIITNREHFRCKIQILIVTDNHHYLWEMLKDKGLPYNKEACIEVFRNWNLV